MTEDHNIMRAHELNYDNNFTIQQQKNVERDQAIRQEWRDARRQFFQYLISNKLKEAGAQKQQQSVLQLFIQHKLEMNSKLKINPKMLGQLNTYEKEVDQLQQAYNYMEQQFKYRLRECWQISQIVERKCTALKVVEIQNKQMVSIDGQLIPQHYVSAFLLFKMIHHNHMLSQVSIKGVKVQLFQQFIQIINPSNHSRIIQKYRQENYWIKELIFPKFLKLAIDAKLQFSIGQKQQMKIKLSNLDNISRIIWCLSGLTIKIILTKWISKNNTESMLLQLWRTLRPLKQIKLAIQGMELFSIPAESIPILRSALFGELASFTQITHFEFENMHFSLQTKLTDYLAIEQIFTTIFDSNPIVHLKLNYFSQFPLLHRTDKLRAIDIGIGSFRKEYNFMEIITQDSTSLQSIRCSSILQKWTISEAIFDRLHNFAIQRFSFQDSQPAHFNNFVAQSPSNIKMLTIQKCLRIDLTRMLPKLSNLTFLSISIISFGYELLSVIPSTQLTELRIDFNDAITDQDLKKIDAKWPQLRCLQLRHCSKLSENAWSMCKFQGLMELRVDSSMQEKSKSLYELKLRGIRVNIH